MKTFNFPFSGVSGRIYTGVNAKLAPGAWFTINQANKLGGRIKKGSKSEKLAIYFVKDSKEERDPEDDKEETKKKFGVRHIPVFNISQIDGIDESKIADPLPVDKKIVDDMKKAVKTPEKAKEVMGGARFDDVKILVENSVPVFLTGPAGCGKSYTCEQVASALGLDFYMSNCIQTKFDLVGFKDASGTYHETPFYKAWKNGGLFLLDEMDASDPAALVTLNNALANGIMEFQGIGNVRMHPNFRVVATGNTVGRGADDQYTGRNCLDAASLDRFIVYACDYETSVQEALFGVEISDFLNEVRSAFKTIGINQPISYRPGAMIKKLDGKLSAGLLIEGAIFKGLDIDTKNQVKNVLKGSKNRFSKALQAA